MTINEQFKEYGVVPVVVLNDAKDALPLAKALVEGGLACAEVTIHSSYERGLSGDVSWCRYRSDNRSGKPCC